MNIKRLGLTCVCSGVILSAFAWGQKGHDVTAAIAEKHLTPKTLSEVTKILDGKSPVYYANWMDNASHTPEYSYTSTWHYKNVDADQSYDDVEPFPAGDVVTALNQQIGVLQNPKSTPEQKNLALKMVIHFVGDAHQPMHVGHASDRGGNSWYVKFFRNNTNLHSIWDTALVESAHKWSYSEWVDQIDRPTEEQLAIIYSGAPNDWVKETYQICTRIYNSTPQESNLSYDYITEWTPTIEEQFLKGGRRLADVLNSIFDPEYMPKTNAVVKADKID